MSCLLFIISSQDIVPRRVGKEGCTEEGGAQGGMSFIMARRGLLLLSLILLLTTSSAFIIVYSLRYEGTVQTEAHRTGR